MKLALHEFTRYELYAEQPFPARPIEVRCSGCGKVQANMLCPHCKEFMAKLYERIGKLTSTVEHKFARVRF